MAASSLEKVTCAWPGVSGLFWMRNWSGRHRRVTRTPRGRAPHVACVALGPQSRLPALSSARKADDEHKHSRAGRRRYVAHLRLDRGEFVHCAAGHRAEQPAHTQQQLGVQYVGQAGAITEPRADI